MIVRVMITVSHDHAMMMARRIPCAALAVAAPPSTWQPERGVELFGEPERARCLKMSCRRLNVCVSGLKCVCVGIEVYVCRGARPPVVALVAIADVGHTVHHIIQPLPLQPRHLPAPHTPPSRSASAGSNG
eukprot:3891709-Rhodomonas_salina.1